MRSIIVVLGLSLFAAGCDGTSFFPEGAPVEEDAEPAADEALFVDAMAAWDAGDYAGARDLFDAVWAGYPESTRHVEAGYRRGRCRFEIGDYTGAVVAFADFRAAHPASVREDDAACYAGRSLYALGDAAGAVTELEASLAADAAGSHAEDARYYLGKARYALGAFAAAAGEFALVESDYPQTTRLDAARYRQGRSWYEAGDPASAIPPHLRVGVASAYGERAAYRLGRSRYSLGQLAGAFTDLERVLSDYATPIHGDDALYYEVRILVDQQQCVQAEEADAALQAAYPSSSRIPESADYLLSGC